MIRGVALTDSWRNDDLEVQGMCMIDSYNKAYVKDRKNKVLNQDLQRLARTSRYSVVKNLLEIHQW